jgi:2-haloacid dehalogenase
MRKSAIEAMLIVSLLEDQYIPFSDVTLQSLKHTLAEHKKSLSDEDTAELMKAYDSLSTFPDVPPALSSLSKDDTITAVVFSNGTQSMVSNSVNRSEDLSQHSSIFKDLVVVEEVKKFKPAPEVYEHLARKVGKEGNHSEMWLVSGNPFDVVGARLFGMQATWVDRAGNGWTDALVEGEKGRPTAIVKSLEEVVDIVKKHARK